MGSIQFIGKEAVLAALDEFDADTWGLFDGKTPILYGEGSDSLGTWLDRFAVAGSTAHYTLRVYDTGLPVTQPNNCIASFKFRLSDPYQGAGISGNTNKLLDRIGELEKRLDEGEGEGEGIMDHVIGWFKDPEKLETVIGAFKQLMGSAPVPAPGPAPPVPTAQAMAGFAVTSDNADDTDEKLVKLAGILDKLEKRDPKLLDHLDKLANLDALTFNLVISKVDAL